MRPAKPLTRSNTTFLRCGLVLLAAGCSSSSATATPDAGPADSGTNNSSSSAAGDAGPTDSGVAKEAAATATGLEILTVSGSPLTAVAGDGVPLKVVQKMSDGTIAPLPSSARVTWSEPATVTALDPSSMAASPMPVAGTQPTARWIDNPGRPDRNADLVGVLFIFDGGTQANGTVNVVASVSGSSVGTMVTASLAIGKTPAGDATMGATTYGESGANCAACHGATGHGTDVNPDGKTYTIEGVSYSFPAPGLNAEMGNCASNPSWNGALFAIASRADINHVGLTLRRPMPDWLLTPSAATTKLLTSQDYADILAFMATQTQ